MLGFHGTWQWLRGQDSTQCGELLHRWGDLLGALGPHRSSVVCLYLPRLAPVDRDMLRQVLVRALDETRAGG